MPTYRMYLDVGATQWIDFVTAVDASESPAIELGGATMFNNGTYSDADLKALQMYQKIAALPGGVRPLITDYGQWSMLELPWSPTISYSVAVVGGGSAVGAYTCQRGQDAISTMAGTLDMLGVANSISTNGQAIYFRGSSPTVSIVDAQATVTSKPAAWSHPALFP